MINPKDKIKPPTIASSLKKLITLRPSGWGTPFISIAPYPIIFVPDIRSIKTSIANMRIIIVQNLKTLSKFL